MTQRVNTCLNLHSLAVCDWAHVPAVCYVMIKRSCPYSVSNIIVLTIFKTRC